MITLIVPEWIVWTAISMAAIHICLLITTIHYQKLEARARRWGGKIEVSDLFEDVGK